MKVSDILRVKGNALFTVAPDATLASAIESMAENDIGSVVVMDHGELMGMLTFREVLNTLHRVGDQYGSLKVRNLMVQGPPTVAPGSSASGPSQRSSRPAITCGRRSGARSARRRAATSA